MSRQEHQITTALYDQQKMLECILSDQKSHFAQHTRVAQMSLQQNAQLGSNLGVLF